MVDAAAHSGAPVVATTKSFYEALGAKALGAGYAVLQCSAVRLSGFACFKRRRMEDVCRDAGVCRL